MMHCLCGFCGEGVLGYNLKLNFQAKKMNDQ